LASQINASNSGFGGIVSTGDSSGVLQLQTAGTTALTIDTSQNVGIGTASPNYKLTFGGQTGGTATPLAIRFSNDYSNGSTAASSKIFLYNDGVTGNIFGIGVGSAADVQYHSGSTGASSGNHRWYTNDIERMRIDTSGNLLVGNTSFTSLGQLNVQSTTSKDGAVFQSNATGDTTQILFRNPNGVIGKISTLNSATSYVTSSDYRLKENIVPMTGALDTVAALKPVTYKWKIDGSNGQGFIAHELAEIVPEAVAGEKDAVDAEGNPIHQGVDTSFLVATLTSAIQEQQTIINDLKARIETLEAK